MQVDIYEYWFNNHERMLLVEENGVILVSIDVFCPKWSFNTCSTHTIHVNDKVTIFYNRIEKPSTSTCFYENIEWIEYVGVKVANEEDIQLVNIRLRVRSKGLNIDEITNIAKCIREEVERECSV